MNFSEHRLGDPLSDILSALQSGTGSQGMLTERVRGGEFDALVRILDRIVQEAEARTSEAGRVRAVAEAEGARIGDLARMGRSRQTALLGAVEDVRGKLERLGAFARESGQEGSATAMRVAADSLDNLRTVLSQALGESAQVRALWDQLEQSSGLLARAAAAGREPGMAHA